MESDPGRVRRLRFSRCSKEKFQKQISDSLERTGSYCLNPAGDYLCGIY